MKKISPLIAISLIAAMAVFFSSCSTFVVKKTAHDFLLAYYIDNDFEAAKKLSTDVTQEPLEQKAMMFKLNPYAEKESVKKFSIKDIEVKKTKAVCFYEIDGQKRRLNLSKVNGAWLVDMPESTSMEPSFSLSLTSSSNSGGFASATSESIRLSDVPETSENK